MSTRDEGWTARTIGMATVVAFSLRLVFKQMTELGFGLDLVWEPILIPALSGAVFLGFRHRGTWLLSLLVYLPLMAVVLFFVSVAMGIGEGNDLP